MCCVYYWNTDLNAKIQSSIECSVWDFLHLFTWTYFTAELLWQICGESLHLYLHALHSVYLLILKTLTLNLPWKMISLRKCGACCSDLEVGDGSTSTAASSAMVWSQQVAQRDLAEEESASSLGLPLSFEGPLLCLSSCFFLTCHFSGALTAPFKALFLSECGVAEVSLQPCYLRSCLGAKI